MTNRLMIIIAGLAIGLAISAWARPTPKPYMPPPTTVSPLPVGCDADLLLHNYRVLSRADSLYVLGHPKAAFNELGRNYAAMDPGACQ